MKRTLGGILFVILLFMLGCGVYGMKLHSLALESNIIFEYRCLHVNPHLISYKNSFLSYADFLNSYPNTRYSPEEVKNFIDQYIAGMRAYIPEETKWLAMQKQFMDRWDFKLIEPWYVQKGTDLQWKMYEAYRDDAVYMLQINDTPGLAEKIHFDYVGEPRQRRDAYNEEYFEFYKMASELRDWKKIFSTVSVPKGCTDENMTIPNTSGSVDWDRDSNSSTPSGIPIDPYGVS